MEMKKRDKLVDALKGYACLLVILGHVMRGVRGAGLGVPYISLWIEVIIWTFHIHLFMFLSGYVYSYTGGWKAKGSRVRFIKHKLLNLGVPYFVFSIVYIIINSMVPSANINFSLSDILYIWKTPVAQYWFLYTLFMLFVIWVVLSNWLSNIQITILILGIAVVKAILGINFGFLESAMSSSFAFGIGTCVQPGAIKKISEKSIGIKLLVIAIHLVVVITLIYMNISNYGVYLLRIILGILASIAFISCLVKIEIVDKFLQFICKYSFSLYLLHVFFTAAIRIAFMKVGITNYGIHIIGGLIFGLLMPIIVAKILEKNKYLNFVFYPSKFIKEKKHV